MQALILYTLLSVVVSFICSILEAVMLSITASEIGVLKKNGNKTAVLLETLKENINRPLASILAVNTASNMLGAAAVSWQVTKLFGSEALGIASGVLTLLILLFSEILPKTIGERFRVYIAPFAAPVIRVLMLVSYPVVILSEKIASLVPIPKEDKYKAKEELIVSAEIHETSGSLHQKESLVIRNLLNLDKMTVADVMTPRSNVYGYQKDRQVQDILKNDKNIRHSRLPIYGEDLDDILGVVHRYRLIEAQWRGEENMLISELSSPVYFVSQSISVANALDQFIKTKQHLFVVIDSYGSTAGIISLEDAIETLLGQEITDEYDEEDSYGNRIKILSKEDKSFILIKNRKSLGEKA